MNRAPLLFLNVLIIAVCGLVYELLAGTLASYVLGDSVTQFSLIIGIYLSAMGAGAWLSGFLDKGLARIFVEVQLGVALLGGLSAPLLFLSFSKFTQFQLVLYPLVFAIGTLVGLEIPLLMRILKDLLDFKALVARVLAFDYIGALVASLLFPLFLVPRLGLVRTSLLTGLLNAAVGLWSTWLLQPLIKSGLSSLRARAAIVIVLLIIGVIKADRLTSLAEDNLFADPIVYAKQSAYQRMIVTRNRAGFQLFLNGHLQFSSTDEYRYHEALVHPALIAAAQNHQPPRRVMILGGGDGLALREVLRYPVVESVTLVDLDPEVTRLAANFPLLTELNQNSIRDARVRVINQDAMIWLEDLNEKFDAAIIDFPDPNSFALGKLYTTRFYRLLKSRLSDQAAVAVQSTSPLFARTSYWCIVRTMEAAGFYARPYHLAVPSFGEWGFVLAKASSFEAPVALPDSLSARLRFLNADSLKGMFLLPADLGPVPVEINRLDNQSLVRYYESEWKQYQ